MCPQAEDYLQDGIRSQRLGVLERALEGFMTAAALAEEPDLRARALAHQANVLRAQCQWDAALAVARQSRTVALGAGLATRAAEARLAEANVHLARGDFDAALPIFHELLACTTDPRIRGLALQNIGNIRAQCGVFRLAEAAFAGSYDCFERAGYRRGQAIARTNQGRVRFERGDAAGAAALLEDALVLAREAEDGELVACTLLNLAEALMSTDVERAQDLACTALGHFRTSGNHLRHAEALRLVGDINAHRGHWSDAVGCYERGLAIARERGARVEVELLEQRLRRRPQAARLTAR